MPLDDQKELFYHVDKHDQVLGSITRGQAHADRTLIHRAVDIIITNNHGQILLQKRSQNKDTCPGFWNVSAGGHVTFGQTYQEAAQRELQEELGINTPLTLATKLLVNLPNETEYLSIFTGKYESTPTGFDLDEIDAVKWVKKSRLNDFIQANDLSPGSKITLKHFKYL